MLRKTVRRCGTLTLVLALAFASVAPVAADEIGGPRAGTLSSVWDWLADLFGFSPAPADAAGDTGLHGIWQEEGAGFEPNGEPRPNGTGEEGPGFEPNGG